MKAVHQNTFTSIEAKLAHIGQKITLHSYAVGAALAAAFWGLAGLTCFRICVAATR